MRTVSEYTQGNILVTPQALFGMKDVSVLMQQGDSVIFYKKLNKDLVNVEFYTNTPCVIFIESGFETLTTFDNDLVELSPKSAVFLAQGQNLHSDYVQTTGGLSAYLLFFDRDVLTEFLIPLS